MIAAIEAAPAAAVAGLRLTLTSLWGCRADRAGRSYADDGGQGDGVGGNARAPAGSAASHVVPGFIDYLARQL
jgi:hypothetical protein